MSKKTLKQQTVAELIGTFIAASESAGATLAELCSRPEIKAAKRKGREHVLDAVRPGVAAAKGCPLVAKSRKRGVGDMTLDENHPNYKTAENRLGYVVKQIMGHGKKVAKDKTPAKKVRVSSDCVAAVEKLLGSFSKKMVLEALKRFQ